VSITATHWLALAAVVFAIGAAGVMLRRNMLIALMSIEMMLNAVNLTLVAASRALFFSLTVAAAEVAVGLALVVAVYRRMGRTDLDDLSAMHD
jgi:NADH-quinone oxidoreductase subunit K